jgi:diguanylate cyclase (GGDEF)-like protein
MSWSRIGGWAAAGFLVLPVPLPTPSLPVQLLPSPSSPVVIATPALPSAAVPTNQAPATAVPGQGSGSGVSKPVAKAAPASPPPAGQTGGVTIPFTAIYVSSPLDIALLGALATLPLLFGIWLLLFGRTLAEARRAREAQIRLLLAADLGLRPRDLATLSTRALFDLREKSAFDELTGVSRRAAGISAAEREIARARRHKTPLTVAFVDIDGLKEANDSRGRAAGDAVIRGLAQALKDGLRSEDVVFRYGGDEFVCVLPEFSSKGARLKLSEIQGDAAEAGIRFCAGVAQLQRSDDVVSLFARADRDLYDFKANRGEIVQLRQPASSRPAAGEEAPEDILTTNP